MGELVLRKDSAHTRCTPSSSLSSVLLACFASRTDRPWQRQAIMASARDRVQVLAAHFASSSTEGQTLDIQAQCTRATAPMLAGQVRNYSASADCERSGPNNLRACRWQSLLVQARVWELRQPSSSLSMAPKWWSQTSIATSLNRYCITQHLPFWSSVERETLVAGCIRDQRSRRRSNECAWRCDCRRLCCQNCQSDH